MCQPSGSWKRRALLSPDDRVLDVGLEEERESQQQQHIQKVAVAGYLRLRAPRPRASICSYILSPFGKKRAYEVQVLDLTACTLSAPLLSPGPSRPADGGKPYADFADMLTTGTSRSLCLYNRCSKHRKRSFYFHNISLFAVSAPTFTTSDHEVLLLRTLSPSSFSYSHLLSQHATNRAMSKGRISVAPG